MLVGGGTLQGLRLPLMSIGLNPKRLKNKKNLKRDDHLITTPSSNIPGTQTIYMKTFGCSPNQSNSECIAGQLLAFGYALSDNPEEADLCVVGVQQIDRVVEVVKEILKGHEVCLLNRKTLPALDLAKTKHAHGNLGSYTIETLVERVRNVVGDGVKEIWINSEDTGAYGHDIMNYTVGKFRAVEDTLYQLVPEMQIATAIIYETCACSGEPEPCVYSPVSFGGQNDADERNISRGIDEENNMNITRSKSLPVAFFCLDTNRMGGCPNRFTGTQRVRPQKTTDEIPDGGTPHTTYINCLHLKKTNKSRMKAGDIMDLDNGSGDKDDDDVPYDQDKVNKLKELSQLPDIYERQTRSFAPNIWVLDDVKKGLLCQLFGGNALTLPSGTSFRGDINILLVGDPGTSKSQLLQYIHKLTPREIYTSGRGSSAVGLTAYVTKDLDSGFLRLQFLESGALVLSDRGICCIDEFDKMSDNARSMLYEVMEQQTVSIEKARIIALLNARTSVLACVNPSSGLRYNPRLSVIENNPPSSYFTIMIQMDASSRQERELNDVISKMQESKKESRLLVETLRSKLEDRRERLVISEKKVRQLEARVQEEQQIYANTRKKVEALEYKMIRVRKKHEGEKVAQEEPWAKVSALELD
ncbi:hypothetical protein GIB67_029395 [Kingdonia uniflora]|uniref:DNA helicase n=1 Tax=Kingdonia uniflora TaxID=39325 RepID=A0A7J7NXS2_9MAGN|nr:hypothetical protein GIB67_029395 [Kingdonia uniflora]